MPHYLYNRLALMHSSAFDDFIDDCFVDGDAICSSNTYASRKYEKKINPIASQVIDGSLIDYSSKV